MSIYDNLRLGGQLFGDVAQGYKMGRQMKLDRRADTEYEKAQTQQAKYQSMMQGFYDNPTMENIQKMMLINPKMADGYQKALGVMNDQERKQRTSEANRIYSLMQGGFNEDAQKEAQAIAESYRNSGKEEEAKRLEQMAAKIEQDPKGAMMVVGGFLHEALGPDKFTEGRKDTFTMKQQAGKSETELKREQEGLTQDELKTKEMKREATPEALQKKQEATQAEIDYKKAQTDQIRSNIALDEATRAELPQAVRDKVDEAVDKASEAMVLSDRAGNLADKYDALLNKTSGLAGRALAKARSALGFQNLEDEINTEYKSLRARGITSNLPQGAASDTDIKLVADGMPSDDAPAETLSRFLRGMQKLEKLEAQRHQTSAEWVTKNKFKGALTNDTQIMGIKVPKGTTYAQFLEKHGNDIYEKSLQKTPEVKAEEETRSKYSSLPGMMK